MIWDKLCHDHADPNWEHYNKVDYYFFPRVKTLEKSIKSLQKILFWEFNWHSMTFETNSLETEISTAFAILEIEISRAYMTLETNVSCSGRREGGGDMELASQEIYKVQIDCEWLVWLGWLVFNGCGYGVCGFFFPNCLKLFILF